MHKLRLLSRLVFGVWFSIRRELKVLILINFLSSMEAILSTHLPFEGRFWESYDQPTSLEGDCFYLIIRDCALIGVFVGPSMNGDFTPVTIVMTCRRSSYSGTILAPHMI